MCVVEELHCQDRKWEDLGSAYYEIRLSALHPNVNHEIKGKGDIQIDSSWVLARECGHIQRVMIVKHNSSKAVAHFTQLYNE